TAYVGRLGRSCVTAPQLQNSEVKLRRTFSTSWTPIALIGFSAFACIAVSVLLAQAVDTVSAAKTTNKAAAPAAGKPSIVKLVKTDAGYQLIRNGQPFFIQGAGGSGPT